MKELKKELDTRRGAMDTKATDFRNKRDDWNTKTREIQQTRNTLNSAVRELILEVKKQRTIRDGENQRVRDMKMIRDGCNKKVRDAKKEIEGSQPETDRRKQRNNRNELEKLKRELRRLDMEISEGKWRGKKEDEAMKRVKTLTLRIRAHVPVEIKIEATPEAKEAYDTAIAEQEKAHQDVTESAAQAQAAHDLMLEWNSEVEIRRSKAEEAHKELRTTKKEADLAHHKYIVSLRCLHSINNMIKTMQTERRDKVTSGEPQLSVDNLMGKLLSGETLTTEELMQLQSMD
jgi:phosphoserine phosphatase